jgi:hypothetical protein
MEGRHEVDAIPLAVPVASAAAAESRLSYGVSVPLWRRRRLRRVLFALVLAGGIGWLLWHRYGPDAVSRIVFVREQQAHLAHREAPETVAYRQAESITFQTSGANAVSQIARGGGTWSRFEQKYVDPNATLVDDSDLPPGGGARPAGPQYNTLVFLHERISPNGTRRLVEVGIRTARFPDAVCMTAMVRLFDPGSLGKPKLTVIPVANRREANGGLISSWPGAVFQLYSVPYGTSNTLYMGNPHPDDASTFLLPYVLDGTSGVIRGRLLDGDRVVFEGRPTASQTGTAPAATAPAAGR